MLATVAAVSNVTDAPDLSITTASRGPGTPRDQFDGLLQLPLPEAIQVSVVAAETLEVT
jgi:hypothetical protein